MKKHHILIIVSSLASIALLSGCVGYNTALFGTKTNVGVDLDTKPPTADITIGRREVAILPSYESGHHAVVGSFVHQKGSGFMSIFPRISTSFAGGDAAKIFTRLYDDADGTKDLQKDDSSLPLTANVSDTKFLWIFPVKMHHPGQVQPFAFGTDTSLGLKVVWSGATGASGLPDSARLGYHRKELAVAPVYIVEAKDKQGHPIPGVAYYAKMGSFLATSDSQVDVGALKDTGISHIQYFATGDAADNLALRKSVRQAMIFRGDAKAAAAAGITEQTFGSNWDNTSDRLNNWLMPNGEPNSDNMDKLKKWMTKNGAGTNLPAFVATSSVAQRTKAIKDLKVP